MVFNSSAKCVYGVDMGSQAIKVVALQPLRPLGKTLKGATGSSAFRIKKKGAVQVHLPLQADGENPEEIKHRRMEALSRLLKRMKIIPGQMKHVVSSLAGGQFSIKQINTARLSGEELQSSLVFEARKHVPVDSEALMDYQVLHSGERTMDVLLVITSRTAVEEHLQILQGCGIKGDVVDAPPLGLINAFLLGRLPRKEEGALLLLNIGATYTQLCLYRPSGLFFTRDIQIAGSHFTEDVAKNRDIEFYEAEAVKIRDGLFACGNDEGPAAKLDPAAFRLANQYQSNADKLIREIQRSIRFYMKETGGMTVSRCYLTGGCARDLQLKSFLESALNQEMVLFNPASEFKGPDQFRNGEGFQYTQSLGLALRGCVELFSH